MRYVTAAAFRQAIEDRIRSRAAGAADPTRLRREIVFERVLARLVRSRPEGWVLKGGVALEARFGDRARATRDLDVAIDENIVDVEALRELVIEALLADPDRDWFRLALTETRQLRVVEAGRPGWRLTIRADLDGRRFETVRVDVVGRTAEILSTERIVLPNSLAFAGLPDVEVEVIDRAQHFAEKLHAFTREYDGRASTRVKDLTDLVLLIEAGIEPNRRLRQTVEHVFEARRTHAIPTEIPAPPVSWGASYTAQAAEIDLRATTLGDAHRAVQAFWVATA